MFPGRYIAIAIFCTALGAAFAGASHAQTLADLVQEARLWNTGIFGFTEIETPSFQGIPQWDDMLERTRTGDTSGAAGGQESDPCERPVFQPVCRFLAAAARMPRAERLDAVNRYFNRFPYRLDRETYGRREYWATPREFILRSGDCEDFAIAKYFALRALGFGADELRIVTLRDEILGIGHAVLAVYTRDDILILDNRSTLILSHLRYRHYTPVYSVNEKSRWVHVRGTV